MADSKENYLWDLGIERVFRLTNFLTLTSDFHSISPYSFIADECFMENKHNYVGV